MIKKSALILFIALVSSCNKTTDSNTASDTPYFSTSALLNEQIDLLLSLDAGLEKHVKTGETSEILELKPEDFTAWKSQLKLFFDADISKPGYIGAYKVEELPDIGSLSKTVYTSLKKKNFVQAMECSYENKLLKEIKIELSKDNEVFQLNQKLFLYFNLESRQSRLSSFYISGAEEMRLKSSLDFDIKATIVIP